MKRFLDGKADKFNLILLLYFFVSDWVLLDSHVWMDSILTGIDSNLQLISCFYVPSIGITGMSHCALQKFSFVTHLPRSH